MAEISCKHCDSPDCHGCNIYRLDQMLNVGKLDTLMNKNRAIQISADVREVVTCAKCRYYSEKRKKCGHINGLSELVFPTDYCSYGSVMLEVQHDD